jgi:hypothetical protein
MKRLLIVGSVLLGAVACNGDAADGVVPAVGGSSASSAAGTVSSAGTQSLAGAAAGGAASGTDDPMSGGGIGSNGGTAGGADPGMNQGEQQLSCGCVEEPVTWEVTGGLGGSPLSTLVPCGEFSHDWRDTIETEGAPRCIVDLTQCDAAMGASGPDVVADALQDPDVVTALQQAPVAYGNTSTVFDTSFIRITVGEKVIDVGSTCATISDACLEIPPGIAALEAVLQRFANEQVARDPTCRALFTSNDLSCEERKQQASSLIESVANNLPDCETADDCVPFELSSACQPGCASAIPKSIQSDLEQTLDQLNTELCFNFDAECGPVIVPPCIPPGAPACIDHQCVLQ